MLTVHAFTGGRLLLWRMDEEIFCKGGKHIFRVGDGSPMAKHVAFAEVGRFRGADTSADTSGIVREVCLERQ